MSVIVTNAKNRIAYNIVKSLGQKGIDVHTSDFVPLSMSFASRYSKSHFLYPSPFKYQKEFIESLIKKIKRLKTDVLMPVFEETFLIAKFKTELEQHVRMVIPDYEQILSAHNKDRWKAIADKLHIPVPRSYNATEIKNRMVLVKKLHFPVLIKPKQGGGAWGISQINNLEELETIFEQEYYVRKPWERFIIQEKIDGETICVAMLFRKGEYRAKVTYKQLRDYPITGGQATLRMSLHNEQAEDSFQKLLEKLKWHGICQADFIIGRENNIPYLIDINPRFWGSLAQGIASGVDFPNLLYKIAVDGDVEPVKDFKADVMTRWIGGDLRTFFPLLKISRNRLNFTRKFIFPGDGKIFLDDLSLKDPSPFFIWGIDALFRILKYKSMSSVAHDSLDGIWE